MPKKIISAALAVLLGGLSAAVATPAAAQSTKDAYLQDGRGVIVRNSNFGDPRIGNLCWRTGYWTPAQSIAECDPDITPKPRPAEPPPAPAPAPKPAPAPAPAAKTCDFNITLANDETFDFNKAVLKPAAKARLDSDVVARAASCARIDLILVTGHTDRIGSQQYNQKLSERRAQVVADYLKGKGMNAADVLGAGKTMPIKSCDDKLPAKELHACLAPNRRVVVEVKGPAK
ncbi:MAG: outer membrane protein/peptidoglycan-associated protein [Betaproteobacteria bacterium]|nr:outer membrane protein/peptidoglycan-associated protein [Betaproteobacteria bacterium]